MNDEQIITEIAKLDGWANCKGPQHAFDTCVGIDPNTRLQLQLPDYLKSRDAILPVIEKQPEKTQRFVASHVIEDTGNFKSVTSAQCLALMLATPYQLCIALLKAISKWQEDEKEIAP